MHSCWKWIIYLGKKKLNLKDNQKVEQNGSKYKSGPVCYASKSSM